MAEQLAVEEKTHFDQLFREEKTVEEMAKLSDASYSKIYRLFGLARSKKKNLKLLDIGCGRGIHSCNFAKMGFRVTAIDISPETIKYAKKKARQKGIEVKFLLGNATKTQLPRNSFDVVVFTDSLHHFYYSGLEKVINEAKRVLKKGGMMILIEPNHLNPYNNLIYSIAHFLEVNQVIRETKRLNIITVNERSLNPFRLLKILKNDFEVATFKFFPYTFLLTKKSTSDFRLLKGLKLFFSTACFILPLPFRYDHFGLKLIKK